MKRSFQLTFAGLAVAALAACSSTPIEQPMQQTTAAAAPQRAMTPTRSADAAPRPTAASTVATVTLPEYLDGKSYIATERSVFFGFDDYAIDRDDTAIVERHGKYLAANPRLAIRIEGNTDERGGSEYNLALGQKRAEAVRRAMALYGAKDGQMEAVSMGEERPRATGHDESAWALNRRADLQYPAR